MKKYVDYVRTYIAFLPPLSFSYGERKEAGGGHRAVWIVFHKYLAVYGRVCHAAVTKRRAESKGNRSRVPPSGSSKLFIRGILSHQIFLIAERGSVRAIDATSGTQPNRTHAFGAMLCDMLMLPLLVLKSYCYTAVVAMR